MNIMNQYHFENPNNDSDLGQNNVRRSLSNFDILGALRRQLKVLAISAAIGGALGLGYVLQMLPSYSSTASVLIDAKNVGMAATTALEGSLAFDTGAVDSQLQILQSDKIAMAVAQRLGLQNNIEFLVPRPSFVGRINEIAMNAVTYVVRLSSGETTPPTVTDLPENIRLLLASRKLQGNLIVGRVGKTYVLGISYVDQNPNLAQAITGQYVNAYLEDQLDSKFESTRRATNWMEDRIRELRSRSLAADQAVQRYRADNNLVAASGRLIDDQSLTDATSQLTAARVALDDASARYQRLKEIVDKQDATASLTESSANPNITQLRGKFLEAAKLYSDMKARYGESHSVAVKASKDMAEYQRLIFEELKSLLPGYQSDVSIAQSRVNSIQETLADLRGKSVLNDSAMVKLRALEQESDSLKVLYSTFLQKSQEMQQQQSFPVTDARIISEPSLPLRPSGPPSLLLLSGFLLVGALGGVGVGVFREWKDRGLRTPSQVRDELGLEFLSNIPVLDKTVAPERRHNPPRRSNDAHIGSVGGGARFTCAEGILREVVDHPLSQFSEAVRALKIKIDLSLTSNAGIVVGLASMFPDEGKSTVAKNLASSLAFQGKRTLLIDGDLRNPSLTRSLLGSPKRGLAEVINERVELSDVIAVEEGSGLAFLPGATRTQQGSDLFSSPRTHQFITKLRQHYDVIVIDFPPVGALTDAFAASSVVDGYVFVAHWGKTPRKSLRELFDSNPRFSEKTLGLALNRVDLKRLERYGSTLGSAHYGKYADRYFPSSS